jgi:hypothetical protein
MGKPSAGETEVLVFWDNKSWFLAWLWEAILKKLCIAPQGKQLRCQHRLANVNLLSDALPWMRIVGWSLDYGSGQITHLWSYEWFK